MFKHLVKRKKISSFSKQTAQNLAIRLHCSMNSSVVIQSSFFTKLKIHILGYFRPFIKEQN